MHNFVDFGYFLVNIFIKIIDRNKLSLIMID